jgi:hypothetical protein
MGIAGGTEMKIDWQIGLKMRRAVPRIMALAA